MTQNSPAPASRDTSVEVAFDTGALHGHRTGVGNAVAWTLEALTGHHAGHINVRPYVTSMRARVEWPERRLPIPAAVAVRMWAHRMPPIDRLLRFPDVVHATNYVVPPTRCARLVSVYDCWFLEHPEEVTPDVNRAAAVLRRGVDDGAHVVTSSDATTLRVRELLATDRVRTIPLGPAPPVTVADSKPPTLPELGDAPFVLALGTLERRKNLPTLIAAFGRLAHEHPTVRLVIAGMAGNDVPAISRAIDRLDPNSAQRVLRTGAIDAGAKAWLLANARALAYPSLDEGFGFPLLEAQRLGTPVVASTAGSIPQVAGGAALLSPPLDAEALAANLHWVVTDDEMHAKLVRRGRSNVKRFSWETTARRLADTYRELAES